MLQNVYLGDYVMQYSVPNLWAALLKDSIYLGEYFISCEQMKRPDILVKFDTSIHIYRRKWPTLHQMMLWKANPAI